MNGSDPTELDSYYIHTYYRHSFRFKLSSFFCGEKLYYQVDPSVCKTTMFGYEDVHSWYW